MKTQEIKMFSIGEHVRLSDDDDLIGTIVSDLVKVEGQYLYAIRLNNGFFNPEKTTFVRLMLVHPDSIHSIE